MNYDNGSASLTVLATEAGGVDEDAGPQRGELVRVDCFTG